MPKFQIVRRVPVSAATMFNVVSDVENYPEFLPYCKALTIIRNYEENKIPIVEADMTVAYGKLEETFRSKVSLDQRAKTITSENLKGPFRQLHSQWFFEEISTDVTDVHFSIDYEFKNRMMKMLMGSLFEKAFRTYAESFETRAKSLV